MSDTSVTTNLAGTEVAVSGGTAAHPLSYRFDSVARHAILAALDYIDAHGTGALRAWADENLPLPGAPDER